MKPDTRPIRYTGDDPRDAPPQLPFARPPGVLARAGGIAAAVVAVPLAILTAAIAIPVALLGALWMGRKLRKLAAEAERAGEGEWTRTADGGRIRTFESGGARGVFYVRTTGDFPPATEPEPEILDVEIESASEAPPPSSPSSSRPIRNDD